jgi:hypothetical protein
MGIHHARHLTWILESRRHFPTPQFIHLPEFDPIAQRRFDTISRASDFPNAFTLDSAIPGNARVNTDTTTITLHRFMPGTVCDP